MITAVIDANVLASGFVRSNPSASPAQLMDIWRRAVFTLIVSEHLLMELAHTFEDGYFRRRLTAEQMRRAQLLLRRWATISPITVEVHGVATHPEDDLVLAAALSAHGGLSGHGRHEAPEARQLPGR